MQIGVLKSHLTPLVSIVPSIVAKFVKDEYTVTIEAHAGEQSFFDDALYEAAGASITDKRSILKNSDIILVDDIISEEDLSLIKAEALIIGKFNLLANLKLKERIGNSDKSIFSIDQVPRSSIAQSMDVLSSMASLAGYRAVLDASTRFPGYFPMMTTAAGTVPPAKVLVLGAGVAGLQAIATARRLGASVEAFDVRSAVKEEVKSLGAKFIEVSGANEDSAAGGYAVTQSEDYIQKQKELIHDQCVKADIVITTANIPGKKAPLLIEKRTVESMQPGSVIIDMATGSGGNCEVSENDKEVVVGGVTILGDSRLHHQLPKEASRLYSTNIYNFVKFLLKDGRKRIPIDHEIVQRTLVSQSVSLAPEIEVN